MLTVPSVHGRHSLMPLLVVLMPEPAGHRSSVTLKSSRSMTGLFKRVSTSCKLQAESVSQKKIKSSKEEPKGKDQMITRAQGKASSLPAETRRSPAFAVP